MAEILGVYLMPHPPIIIPDVGKGAEKRIQKTTDALNACCEDIMGKAPKTIVLITPHGHVLNDCLTVMTKKRLEGNLSRFSAPIVSAAFDNDTKLANEIVSCANARRIPCIGIDDELALEHGISTSLDWGALVPLSFVLKKYRGFKLVYIAVSRLSNEELYQFGVSVQKAIETRADCLDAVIICSGDLSHVLSANGPYGYHPKGLALDSKILKILKTGDVKGLLGLDNDLVEDGKECALKSLIIGMGTLDGYSFASKVLSYEGPFGVGYAVASFEPKAKSPDRKLSGKQSIEIQIFDCDSEETNDIYVQLAEEALKHYLKTGELLKVDAHDLTGDMLTRRAGVFVSIKKDGRLRGCIGTISAIRKNIAEEIVYNAISAGTEDTRFMPIEANELDELEFSVDILSDPYSVKSLEDLDVKKYGVIVRSGRRTGLLLPDIEGINTPREQVEIALDKAGIRMKEIYTIERFEVERHKQY